jgi:predicted metal-dependent hydrolase
MLDRDRITKHSLRYGEQLIRFSLRRKVTGPATRIAIHVDPDGGVLVDAPEDASLAAVLAAVKKRSRWISQHLELVHERMGFVLPREYVSGETLHYLGRRYRLKVLINEPTTIKARMRGRFIEVTVPTKAPALIQEVLDKWYRNRANEVFADRLSVVALPLRWVKQLPQTRLQFMKVQWGSCSPTGRLTLNPLLVKAPRECIDYVLLHELCHLLHHNHSKQFYKTLDRHMPQWPSIKERLDNMAPDIFRV